jgi:protein subunit release factor B
MAERLIRLEERQKAHERENDFALASINGRIDGVETTIQEMHQMVSATNDGIAEIKNTLAVKQGISDDKGKQKLALWQILAIIGAFTGPTLAEKIFKLMGW